MKVLGIETSTKTGSVAIVSESGVVAQYSLNIEITHSERLMTTIDRVLRDTGATIADMDAFSVAIGPGSFTGLRIGLAAIKGLALALNKPVAAVPTLEALAWNVPHAAYPVCPMLDARKNEVYAAVYRYDEGRLEQLVPEAAIAIRDLRSRMPAKIIFSGEAARLYRREIENQFGADALFAPLTAGLPSAAAVAEIGRASLLTGVHADPDLLTPLYIRRPEAEVAWEKKQQSQ